MHQIHLQLTDQLYAQAQRRASEAGFASLDEYIVGVVSEDLASEQENLDHRFTPAVVAHLDQLRDEIQAGTTTYSETDVDTYLQEKSQAWRASHPG